MGIKLAQLNVLLKLQLRTSLVVSQIPNTRVGKSQIWGGAAPLGPPLNPPMAYTHIPHEKDFKKSGMHLLPARAWFKHWLPNNTHTLTITQAPIQSHPIAVI